MEVRIPHTSRMNPGLKSPGKSLKRWYSDFRRGSVKLAKKVILGKLKKLQRLLLKSRSAKFLAVRQVTQLNAGKKTPGIDGKSSLNDAERIQLIKELQETLSVLSRASEARQIKGFKRT